MADGLLTVDELVPEVRTNTIDVRFFIKPEQNDKKTKEAGRPVFEDIEWVEIHIPGDRDFICQPATQRDRDQYPRQYEAFQKKESQATVSGFPLSEWAQMRRSLVEEARVMGVHTVEQLASVPDTLLQRFGPGWVQLRQMARDWEKKAKSGAETVKLRTELDAAIAHIKTLETMLAKQAQELHRDPSTAAAASPPEDVRSKIEVLPKDSLPPKRRGRPPGSKNKPKNGTEAKPE